MNSAAARYSQFGWSIIPVDGTTKKPLIPTWKEFRDRLASDEEIDTWSRRFPNAGIAVICGPVSGLLVLDADGEEGSAEAMRRGLPKTPTVQTPRGGLHAYFQLPKDLKGFKNTTKIGDSKKLDVRGHASYVVAPFTKRSDGRKYEWLIKPSTKLAKAPEWFLGMLRQLAEKAAGANPHCGNFVVQSGTTRLPQAGVGLAPVLARLSETARGWVLLGHDRAAFKSRSENDFAAVTALFAAGATEEQIHEIFGQFAIGDRIRRGEKHAGYLDMTIRGARRAIRAVRIKYADLVEYEAGDGRSACKRVQLLLIVEDGEEIGRGVRVGVTVPMDSKSECLSRWQRFYEALGLRPLFGSEVSHASCRNLIGRTMLIELNTERQNPVVAFHRGVK